jgi:hypothetical protein
MAENECAVKVIIKYDSMVGTVFCLKEIKMQPLACTM